MSEIRVSIPDYLQRQAELLAHREKSTLDYFVSRALASHVTARLEKNYLEDLAARGGWERAKTAFYSRPSAHPRESARR